MQTQENKADTFNIQLTQNGEFCELNIPPATIDQVVKINYLVPIDDRCERCLVQDEAEDDIKKALQAVLGSNFKAAPLSYDVSRKVQFKLSGTACLGYIKYTVEDVRLNNVVGYLYEIFADSRMFNKLKDSKENMITMAEVISFENDAVYADCLKDEALAQFESFRNA